MSTRAGTPSMAPGSLAKHAESSDGTRIAYEVVGRGEDVVFLANGLGGRLYAWKPLIDALGDRYRFVSWDYRGLFDSDSPSEARHLRVSRHVEDAHAIMDAEEIERAVFCGWSMGVQISLDFAASYPKRVAGLVLLNGTYGQTLRSGLQPVLPMPFFTPRMHDLIEFVRKRKRIAGFVAKATRLTEGPTVAVFSLTAGRERAKALKPLLRRYQREILGESFENFLRLFQELEAHSVYHLLPEIEAPTLLVSGAFDVLTPQRQSSVIARRMPDAEHIALRRASHFALLERPDVVLPAIEAFLSERAHWAS